MADPKYANLPGIDLNQPDVYETCELPEDDQALKTEEEPESESVERLNVSPSEAFEHFKSKPGIDGTNIDFSTTGHGNKGGYKIPATEYEISGAGSTDETPSQKYRRLQHEVTQLTEEVAAIKDNSGEEQVSAVTLATQVEYLKQQLSELHLDQVLGGGAPQLHLTDPQAALQKRLLTELDGFKAAVSSSKETADGSQSGESAGDQVTYNLYYRPEQAKFGSSARIADVEERLERLEALLGNNPEKLSVLTADTANKSLLGAVAVISAKNKLLDASHLDQVEGRLHVLNQRLSHLTEKKESAEKTDTNSKVDELYDLVKKWDSMANTLPHIVDRMAALKELHMQALQFSQALSALDSAQVQISSHLHTHADMLKQVQSTLTENMDVIRGNCESLDGRIKSLLG